jgi:hypothetical protein
MHAIRDLGNENVFHDSVGFALLCATLESIENSSKSIFPISPHESAKLPPRRFSTLILVRDISQWAHADPASFQLMSRPDTQEWMN